MLSTKETPEQVRERQVEEVVNVRGTGEAKAGDSVILWRRGIWDRDRENGIVAVGHVVESVRALDLADFFPSRDRPELSSSSTEHAVRIRFETVLTNSPLTRSVLRGSNLGTVARQAEQAHQGVSDHGGMLRPLRISDEHMDTLIDLTSTPLPRALGSPAGWVVRPGTWVSRSELHSVYGGNPRLDATVSRQTANAFLIYHQQFGGVKPYWSGETLLIPGAVQRTGYATTENLAIIGHLLRGVSLRVFELAHRRCLYVGEFLIDQDNPVERWEHHDDEHIVPILRLGQLTGQPKFGFHNPLPQYPPQTRLRLQISCDPPETGSAAGSPKDRSAATDADTPPSEMLRRLVTAFEQDPDALNMVSDLEDSQVLAALVQHAQRRRDLARLEAVINDPATGELNLQKQLETMTWIFGGEFLAEIARRGLHVKHQLDLPLIRPDGSLHVVELKVARIRNLITEYRGGLVLASGVSKAIGQAKNYLVALDENRHQILNDFGIDTRRTSVTIVAGHSAFVGNGITRDQIAETLRTNNTHLSRIEIMTYDQVIANARHAIEATEPRRRQPSRR
ncbi:Shedu anti-phage system protein SduA domain-containing protein [Nocardia wallacei]|uniref:Shedu anti-phage system protein SduA domain-containing protein n=1 Tax=Nocardia wallacei TaxID=480035 RepID=UPI0024553321|nr:Shedu anti-phage system protein SduA domain-containing protein [Nocardia wallacei]